jgi:hypothetical protein
MNCVPTNSPGFLPLQSPLASSLFARLPGKFPHGVFEKILTDHPKGGYRRTSAPLQGILKNLLDIYLINKIVDSPEVSHLVGGGTALKGSRAGL